MSEELPEPLTPADCDLRDFPFMPLDVVRLRDSDLAGHENPEVFRTAVLSWCVSWHQVPAGSLPDDDTKLARLFGFGRDLDGWKAVRHSLGGLYGWIRCSDGRLYHPIVAEKAAEAWDRRKRNKSRTRAATEARRGNRDDERNVERDERRNEDRNDPSDDRSDVAVTVHQGQDRTGQRDRTQKTGQHSTATAARRNEDRNEDREQVGFKVDQSDPALIVIQAFDQARVDAYGPTRARPNPHAADLVHARRWVAAGHDPQALYGLFLARQQARAAKGKDPIESLGFLEAAVAELAGVAAPQGTVTSAAIRFMSPDAELRARKDWFNREREAANARGDAPPTDLARFGLWYDAHNGQQIRLMAGDRPPIPPVAPREAAG